MDIGEDLQNEVWKGIRRWISITSTTTRLRLPIHQMDDRGIPTAVEWDLYLIRTSVTSYGFKPAEFQCSI
ncbi:hypothetical protein LK07_33295 [Streptomyces pluripotens]|uniref:Uncharacterized protein n=1 Tax=Streptomyces pluripotens TaxID=1355015 RepID=A0A221P7L0_9ACTN|nr:hypothetical protein LK06_032105 [Streptomyces pluripotens]ASN28076.1 hypothetical protein LK07_33295 [Streptomyces pluripotens]